MDQVSEILKVLVPQKGKSNASVARKLGISGQLLGHYGAGMLSELLDYLREQKNYKAPCSSIPEIAYLLHAEIDKLSSLINDFEIFVIERESFFCPWLIACLKPLEEKRKMQSEAAKTRNKEYWDNKRSVTDKEDISKRSVTDQLLIASKVKESIEKKSKVKDSNPAFAEEFEKFWNLYDKKVDRLKVEKVWSRLTQSDKEKINDHLPGYIKATPDKKYRKDPIRYLQNKAFENEIINENGSNLNKNANSSSVPVEKLGTSKAREAALSNW